jgi:hypothetical protein
MRSGLIVYTMKDKGGFVGMAVKNAISLGLRVFNPLCDC